MADSDTALALFAYRIIQTRDSSFEEFESHIRLFREDKEIKKLLPEILLRDTTIHSISSSIDNLNKRFLRYAKSEVEAEIKEFGQSDGPLFEFVKNPSGK